MGVEMAALALVGIACLLLVVAVSTVAAGARAGLGLTCCAMSALCWLGAAYLVSLVPA